jgi:hypothetical protein
MHSSISHMLGSSHTLDMAASASQLYQVNMLVLTKVPDEDQCGALALDELA